MERVDIQLFNTESRSKEVFTPLAPPKVKIYTCGPTVYHYAHIGNFRAYLFEDLLRRTLKFFGYEVEQVMNLTDLDDKTIRGAIAKKISLDDFTKPYIDAFFADLKSLRVEPAEHYPAATHYIQEMIEMIEKLLEKGVAYVGQDGSVYYSISRFPSYGRLSHLNLSELKAGASERVTADEYTKENVSDFVLWKAYEADRDGEVFWESPWGKGRPGWHLECSAMAMKILGETIDIHVGGIDNMFPHHENEIAQSEACSGKPFVKLWMHCDHLIVDGKKMSKSLGNFYTLRDLLGKGFTGREVRYMLLQTHYKTPLNFTFAGLEAVRSSLSRLDDFVYRLNGIEGNEDKHLVAPLLQSALDHFSEALADDLNASAAFASLFEMVREVNALSDQKAISRKEAQEVLSMLRRFDQVLGLLDKEEEVIPEVLLKKLEQRQEARRLKQWAAADQYRDEIIAAGFLIEDTPQGARLKKVGA